MKIKDKDKEKNEYITDQIYREKNVSINKNHFTWCVDVFK